MTRSIKKELRQKLLIAKLEEEPFLTDGELAAYFDVSVPTIRLDRAKLNISEMKERIKVAAIRNQEKPIKLENTSITGELMEINLKESAISLLETEEKMTFQGSRVVRGDCIYSMAESLSIAAIGAKSAVIKVGNIKYKQAVYAGDKLMAKAEVKGEKENTFTVWVFIFRNREEVFRGKFILVPIEENKE